MNIDIAKERIKRMRQENRPWNIALGVLFGVGAIIIDFYMRSGIRGQAQEALWSICSVGFLLIASRRVLRRTQLLLPFGLTLVLQLGLVMLARPLFPLSNSLQLIFIWVPGIALLGIAFAAFARLIDPKGPRPD
jgi:hypothetical protein